MQNFYDNFLGPFIFISIVSLLISAFILPKTKLSKYFRVNEKYFVFTNIIGIISGVLGLIAIFSFSPDTVKSYLWKILIMPYVYLQIYTLYVMVGKKTTKIYDEKQDFNMSSGAGITLGVMVAIMGLIVMPLIMNQILEIRLLFPFFLNSTILVFCLATLYLYKKA
jgi:hypothetical protein